MLHTTAAYHFIRCMLALSSVNPRLADFDISLRYCASLAETAQFLLRYTAFCKTLFPVTVPVQVWICNNDIPEQHPVYTVAAHSYHFYFFDLSTENLVLEQRTRSCKCNNFVADQECTIAKSGLS